MVQNSLVVIPAKKRVPTITSLEFKTNVRGLIRTGRAVLPSPQRWLTGPRPLNLQCAPKLPILAGLRWDKGVRPPYTVMYRTDVLVILFHLYKKSIRTTNNPQHFDQSLAALLLQHVYNCSKHRTNKTQIQTDTRRHINLRKLTFGYNLENCQFCEHNKGFSGEKKLYWRVYPSGLWKVYNMTTTK